MSNSMVNVACMVMSFDAYPVGLVDKGQVLGRLGRIGCGKMSIML